MKTLHTFKIKVEDKETEVALKALSRRDREDLAVIYSAEYGKATQKGLAPFAALRKAAIDAGGFWSEAEINRADSVVRRIVEVGNEIALAVSEEGLDTADKQSTLNDLLAEFQEYKKPETELYSRSAEYEAEKNSVVWCVLNFTTTKNDKGEWVYVFSGTTTESKLNYYYECLEAEKAFEQEAFEKAYLCFYHHIKNKEETTPEVLTSLTSGQS